ncbi:MAG: hypothetical protein U5K76_09970 [Woeseiaceae bacterium]|nr:hypothetical protein [Woeseiaceae bacterium]
MSSPRSRSAGTRNGNCAAVIQDVPAQLAFGNGFVNVAIGGRDNACVDICLLLLPDRANLAGLDGSQQLGLQAGIHLGDLIQEKRAA